MRVSKELQDLVKKNKNLKKVYFDEEGKHYFTKFEIDVHEVDDMNYSVRVLKVDSLPGAKRAAVKTWKDKKKGISEDKLVNVSYTPVHTEMTRDEILSAKVSTNHMNDEEKLAILMKASEIMKDKSNLELLKTLKQ